MLAGTTRLGLRLRDLLDRIRRRAMNRRPAHRLLRDDSLCYLIKGKVRLLDVRRDHRRNDGIRLREFGEEEVGRGGGGELDLGVFQLVHQSAVLSDLVDHGLGLVKTRVVGDRLEDGEVGSARRALKLLQEMIPNLFRAPARLEFRLDRL